MDLGATWEDGVGESWVLASDEKRKRNETLFHLAVAVPVNFYEVQGKYERRTKTNNGPVF
jgi:hypothetical protein